MNPSIAFRHLIGFVFLCSLVRVPQAAAQDASQVSISGLVGASLAPQSSEVLIYYIELQEIAGGRDATLKTGGAGTEEIRFTITDIVGSPTGLVAADISALSFYTSSDNVFDVGDVLQRSIVPGALGAQTIGFGAPPIASPDIPDAPASTFFLITATIAAGATSGHRFRFGAAAGHIDIRDNPPPGGSLNYTLGTLIAANDADYIEIGTGGASPGTLSPMANQKPIPVGLEWVVGMGFFGYGAYRLVRRRREN